MLDRAHLLRAMVMTLGRRAKLATHRSTPAKSPTATCLGRPSRASATRRGRLAPARPPASSPRSRRHAVPTNREDHLQPVGAQDVVTRAHVPREHHTQVSKTVIMSPCRLRRRKQRIARIGEFHDGCEFRLKPRMWECMRNQDSLRRQCKFRLTIMVAKRWDGCTAEVQAPSHASEPA